MFLKNRIKPDFKRSHSICLLFTKFLLLICIVTCFTLSIISFRKATLHLNSSNINETLSSLLQCPHINQSRVHIGRKHFSQSRVIIAGLIRDREEHIESLRLQLYSLTRSFADYAIVIVENDSKDRTREKLLEWTKHDSHVHVIGCGDSPSCQLSLAETKRQFRPEISRIQKMVRLRNIYLDYIDNHQQLSQYDYLVVEDFDLKTYTYTDGLYSTGFHFQNDSSINAICSNGIYYNRLLNNLISYETYFDPYAHKDQYNLNWSMVYNDLWSTMFRQYACQKDLISVYSCFSGRTIYRYRSIRGKHYRTYLDRNQQAICEHVGLHEYFPNIYLNSEMIFYVVANNIVKNK